MKKNRRPILVLLIANLVILSCQDTGIDPKDKGTLKLSISAITITSTPSGGRTKGVSTDDFIVRIYKVGDDDPVFEFDPWSSAPESIELETGQYFADATNLASPDPAAFEQPWYYGKSDPFTIDKEELKEVSIECKMANYKVAFNYSQNVVDNFTSWSASAARTVSGESLTWVQGDSREGYFLTGEGLSIDVHLAYQKQFESGEITRDFHATIAVPNPATLYRLNVNATLANGQIQININVDDSFETEDIELGDAQGGGENTVTDANGNIYPTVQIGTQVWMAKNLAVTTLNDGTPIPNVTGVWNTSAPAYAWFNNDEATFKNPNGAIYNFYAVQTGKLCPTGWHVPSTAEALQLMTALGGAIPAGGKLKEAGTTHWNSPNTGATNESGFTAVGSGIRDPSGIFYGLRQYNFLWLNTGNQTMALYHDQGSLGLGGSIPENGQAVRCVKD